MCCIMSGELLCIGGETWQRRPKLSIDEKISPRPIKSKNSVWTLVLHMYHIACGNSSRNSSSSSCVVDGMRWVPSFLWCLKMQPVDYIGYSHCVCGDSSLKHYARKSNIQMCNKTTCATNHKLHVNAHICMFVYMAVCLYRWYTCRWWCNISEKKQHNFFECKAPPF